MQSSTENLHYVYDLGEHPTAVTCLPIVAESLVKVRFNLSSGAQEGQAQSIHIYGMFFDGAGDLGLALSGEIANTLSFGFEAKSFAKHNT